MKKRPVVALLIETSNSYARDLLRGVMDWVNEHTPWSIYLPEQGRGDRPPSWLAQWQGDGIIARIENPVIAKTVVQKGLPTVDVSAGRHAPHLPWVETDDRAIAQQVAEHLMERGFTNFGFCAEPYYNWSRWRQEHFTKILAEAGFTCHVYPSARQTVRRAYGNAERQRLCRWVRDLPKPVGVMAAFDIKAQQLLDACREEEIAVPESVAVIGVDNDELLCNLTTPPLSSVILNSRRTGYEAATLLDRMMHGKRVAPEAHLIKPLGIATRQSTDVLAIDDTEIATAVQFIREHACDGINVHSVLRAVPLSRRILESRFRAILGRTPHAEIVRIRMQRVQQLLAETDLNMEQIARCTGFRHVEYLSTTFNRLMGEPPSVYRAKHRG